MTSAYNIVYTSAEPRIEFDGQILGVEQLSEAIWLCNIELRGGCSSRREKRETRRLIAQYEALLGALQSAGP